MIMCTVCSEVVLANTAALLMMLVNIATVGLQKVLCSLSHGAILRIAGNGV